MVNKNTFVTFVKSKKHRTMEEKIFNTLRVKISESEPKFKEYREANDISLEQASELSGITVEAIQNFESGKYCLGHEMEAYHLFFLQHIPNALDLYEETEDGLCILFDYIHPDTAEEETGAELVIEAYDEAEDNGLQICIPELGPKFKEWREASNISLKQASEFSGLEIEAIERLESGEKCPGNDLSAYHQFFFEHIPNAGELYYNFMDEILANHGYTYDEEGNEYKDGVRTDMLDEE